LISCILCRKGILPDEPGIIHGVLWKGIEIKEDYIEISICSMCRERIKEGIQGKMNSSPLVRMVFNRYLKLVGNDILNFLKE